MEEVSGIISDRQYYIALPLNKIKKHPVFESLFQRSENDIKAMEEAIRKDGMIDPLVVVKQGDEYVLIDGYTRYEALKRLGITKATAIVIDHFDLRNEEKLLFLKQLALSVNAVRRHLKPEQLMQVLEELEELRAKTKKEDESMIDAIRDRYAKILRENYDTTIEALDLIIAEAKKYPGFFKALQKAFNETEKLPPSTTVAGRLLSLFSEEVKKSITANDADLLSFIVSNFYTIYGNKEFVMQLRSAKSVEELRKVVADIKEQLERKNMEGKINKGKKKKKSEESKQNTEATETIETKKNEKEDTKDVKVINVNIKIDNHVTVQEPKDDKKSNLELIDREYLRKFIDEIEEEARHHEVYLHEYLLKSILPVVRKEAPEVVGNLKPLLKNEKMVM